VIGSSSVPQDSSGSYDVALHDAVREAVVVADPMHFIARGASGHQYDPAAASIFARLGEAGDAADVERIAQEEFARWFAADGAGSSERYSRLAASIWRTRTLLLGEPE
jgi:hypothetical protein